MFTYRYVDRSYRFEFDQSDLIERARVICVIQTSESPFSATEADLQYLLSVLNVPVALVFGIGEHWLKSLIVFSGGSLKIEPHTPIDTNQYVHFNLINLLTEPLEKLAFLVSPWFECHEHLGKNSIEFAKDRHFFDGEIFSSLEKAQEQIYHVVQEENFESHCESLAAAEFEERAYGRD